MSSCSFLSTADSKIECFNDCAFYNWEENGGVCPFKSITGSRYKKMKGLFPYDMFADDSIEVKGIDQYYLEKEYV
jgi:hypothetical protein